MSRVSAEEHFRKEQEITASKMGRYMDKQKLEEFMQKRKNNVLFPFNS